MADSHPTTLVGLFSGVFRASIDLIFFHATPMLDANGVKKGGSTIFDIETWKNPLVEFERINTCNPVGSQAS
jgi:hypothetical protein